MNTLLWHTELAVLVLLDVLAAFTIRFRIHQPTLLPQTWYYS